MDHAEEVFQRMLPSDDQPAEMLEPGKQPFDLPAAAKAPERAAILSAAFTTPVVRRNHLNTCFRQFVIQPVRAVGIVPNEAPQRFSNDELGERPLNQRHFVRRRALRAKGDGKPCASEAGSGRVTP
jgi:ribosomal protein L16 Arg81 hydroxylase